MRILSLGPDFVVGLSQAKGGRQMQTDDGSSRSNQTHELRTALYTLGVKVVRLGLTIPEIQPFIQQLSDAERQLRVTMGDRDPAVLQTDPQLIALNRRRSNLYVQVGEIILSLVDASSFEGEILQQILEIRGIQSELSNSGASDSARPQQSPPLRSEYGKTQERPPRTKAKFVVATSVMLIVAMAAALAGYALLQGYRPAAVSTAMESTPPAPPASATAQPQLPAVATDQAPLMPLQEKLQLVETYEDQIEQLYEIDETLVELQEKANSLSYLEQECRKLVAAGIRIENMNAHVDANRGAAQQYHENQRQQRVSRSVPFTPHEVEAFRQGGGLSGGAAQLERERRQYIETSRMAYQASKDQKALEKWYQETAANYGWMVRGLDASDQLPSFEYALQDARVFGMVRQALELTYNARIAKRQPLVEEIQSQYQELSVIPMLETLSRAAHESRIGQATEKKIPPSISDHELDIWLNPEDLTALFLLSDQPIDLKTNDPVSPGSTLHLEPFTPYVWDVYSSTPCPFTILVERVYATNTSSVEATLQVQHSSR